MVTEMIIPVSVMSQDLTERCQKSSAMIESLQTEMAKYQVETENFVAQIKVRFFFFFFLYLESIS